MLKAVENLIKAHNSKKIGNHDVEIRPDAKGSDFFRTYNYHGHSICMVDNDNRVCMTNHCGWGTSSTSRAINDYVKHYVHKLGYLHVNADELGIRECEMYYKMREGNFSK